MRTIQQCDVLTSSFELKNAMIEGCTLLFSTLVVAGRDAVARARADTVIIDEACQVVEAQAFLALRMAVITFTPPIMMSSS